MIGQEGTVARSFGDAEVGSSIPLGDDVVDVVADDGGQEGAVREAWTAGERAGEGDGAIPECDLAPRFVNQLALLKRIELRTDACGTQTTSHKGTLQKDQLSTITVDNAIITSAKQY